MILGKANVSLYYYCGHRTKALQLPSKDIIYTSEFPSSIVAANGKYKPSIRDFWKTFSIKNAIDIIA
jgi:hypothetical protein